VTQRVPGQSDGPFGVVFDEPSELYHANGAIGSSMLNDFLDSEALFHGRYVRGLWRREPSRDMIVGTAAHTLLLEGREAFRARFAIQPAILEDAPWHGSRKACKLWVDIAEAGGRIVLSGDDGRLVRTIVLAVRQNGAANDLLRRSRTEVTMRMWAQRWGLPLQVRADMLEDIDGRAFIRDLKTCDTLDSWERYFATSGYHRQAQLYLWVAMNVLGHDRPGEFTFIVVEKRPPHRVGLYQLSEAWLSLAWNEMDEGLTRLAKRLDNGEWIRDADRVRTLEPPVWYVRKQEASAW
jgi:hypothetical protein